MFCILLIAMFIMVNMFADSDVTSHEHNGNTTGTIIILTSIWTIKHIMIIILYKWKSISNRHVTVNNLFICINKVLDLIIIPMIRDQQIDDHLRHTTATMELNKVTAYAIYL